MGSVREHEIPFEKFRKYLFHEESKLPEGYVGNLGHPSFASKDKGSIVLMLLTEFAIAVVISEEAIGLWNDIELGFKIAFKAAWDAYLNKSIPIGACILTPKNELVSIGKNQIYSDGTGKIKRHQLAHAEANAILEVNEYIEPNMHPDIRTYTLYTVMEPCPFCFGAIVMGSIRNVKFAARDGNAGAVSLNDSIDYIRKKNIKIEGPFLEMEKVQIAIQACYEIDAHDYAEKLLRIWETYCPAGVEMGRRLNRDKLLAGFAQRGYTIEYIYDFIVSETL